MFWFCGKEASGIIAPWPRMVPTPHASESEVWTTGPPEKSQVLYL